MNESWEWTRKRGSGIGGESMSEHGNWLYRGRKGDVCDSEGGNGLGAGVGGLRRG